MARDDSRSGPSPDERRAQMVEAFKVYRTGSLIGILDRPRTYAFIDGLVIEGHVAVVSADPAGLVLAVDRAQLAALERTGTVLLESPLHGATFRATVDDVDLRRAYVSLSGLQPFNGYRERRGTCRVVPALPLLAKVRGRGEAASGRLVDLSARSLAADFDRAGFSRVCEEPLLRLEVWGEADGTSSLPDFETTARIRRTAEPGARIRRAVLELDAFPALGRALHRYVAGRQRDILVNLRLAGSKRRMTRPA